MQHEVRDMRAVEAPRPGTRPLYLAGERPAVEGCGPCSYRCAGCGAVLIRAVTPGLAASVVVRCGRCGTCNEA